MTVAIDYEQKRPSRSTTGMPASPERILWQTVLLQIVDDALSGASGPNRERDTAAARDYLTAKGPDMRTVCELAGMDPDAVAASISKHLATTPPPKPPKPRAYAKTLSHAGHTRTIPQWAKAAGLPTATLRLRLKKGWSVEDALSTPLRYRKGRQGVASNFTASQGTAGGRSAQDRTEIEFQEPAE